jgi:hypothetical protein
MTTALWREIEPEAVPPLSVTPTQPRIVAELLAGGRSWCGDVYPHVVRRGDRQWLEDGHHRVALAIILCLPLVVVRVLELADG